MLRARGWILLLMAIGLARGLLYAHLIPLWQGPDEPGHYEYARLAGQLGRVPTRGDADSAIEQEILRSLRDHRFWALTRQTTPEVLPAHLADDRWLSNAGPQIGAESPLYYVVPALLTRALPDIESQARALRIFSVSLYVLTLLAIAIGASAIFEDDALLRRGIPLFVALAPMPTFIGSIINNDALANLAGAAFFAVLATTWRRRWCLPQVSALVGSLAVAVLVKRTCWFLVPTAVAACYIHEPGWRPGALLRRLRARRLLIGVALTLALGIILVAGWQNPDSPAGWRLNPERAAAPRLLGDAHRGAYSLLVEDDDPGRRTYASQILPESRILGRQGDEIRAQVWVKALRPGTTACILLDDGPSTTSACIEPSGAWQPFVARHVLAADASYLRVVLAVGDRGQFGATGSFLADDVTLRSDTGSLSLANAGFEAAASPLLAWTADLATRLQWPAGLWHGWFSAASYAPAHLERYALYVALTFVHFWGDFGWLQLPLPIGWYMALAAVSGLSLLGLARRVVQAGRGATTHEKGGSVADIIVSGFSELVERRPQHTKESAAVAGLQPCPPGSVTDSEGGSVADRPQPGRGPQQRIRCFPNSLCIFKAGVQRSNGWFLLMFAATLFALAATYLPMIGQRWQPQGRYLFPALTPLVTLLLLGLRSWLPRRLSPGVERLALAGWILLLFALDQAALWGVLYRAYY